MPKFALKYPFFIIMMCLVVMLIGVVNIASMPVDLFPKIDMPVVVVATFYNGMPPQQIEADITNTFERFFTLGANIDHSESRSLTGVSLIKIYFKPGTDPNAALSNIANLAMADLRRLPPGTLTPVVLGMDASSQPVCLLTLKGQGLNERRKAEKAILALRSSINVDLGTPQTVCDLAAHYRAHELTQDKKSFSTIDNHRHLFKRYIEPRWGNLRLGAVRTMEVEEWLHSLSLAPSSKAKL